MHVPPDTLRSSAVVSCAVRNKISHTALASVVSTIIGSCGDDIGKFNLHASSSYRYQVAAEESISHFIKEEWKAPTVGTVHWDEKCLPELDNKYKKVEKMPVLVTRVYWY